MNTIEQRARFETWADSEALVLHRYGNGKYGYERAITAKAWEAWQAAIAAQQCQGVPDGWALVPIKPTNAMLSAGSFVDPPDAVGQQYIERSGALQCWNLMLAAAPAPESP